MKKLIVVFAVFICRIAFAGSSCAVYLTPQHFSKFLTNLALVSSSLNHEWLNVKVEFLPGTDEYMKDLFAEQCAQIHVSTTNKGAILLLDNSEAEFSLLAEALSDFQPYLQDVRFEKIAANRRISRAQ